MASIIEFFIKLKDGISSPLNTVTRNSTLATNSLNTLSGGNERLRRTNVLTGKSMKDLEERISTLRQNRELIPNSAERQLQAVNREIRELTREMERMETMDGSNKVKGWFNDALGEIPPILKNPVTIIGAGLGFAMNEGMKNSKDKLDFTNLLDESSGNKLFEGLKKNKALLGDGVFGGGKELLQAGVDVGKIAPMVERLGNVSGGSQEKLAMLTASFADVQKEGKLTEGNLGSLMDAGFKPLTILQAKTGESMKSLQKRFEDGKISAEEIGKALEYATEPGGQFHGVLDKIANSPTGKLDILTSQVFGLAEGLGTALLPVASTVFDVLGVGFEWLNMGITETVSLFKQTAQWAKRNEAVLLPLGGAVLGLVTAYQLYQFQQQAGIFWKIKDSVITPILTVAKGGLTAATTGLATAQGFLNAMFLASPIGWVVVGIGALVGGVMLAWKKFEGFRKVIYGLWESFKAVFTSIGKLFKQIFSPIGEAIQAVKDGNWGAAAKATAKLVFNVSPVGILKNTVEFTKGGGFDNVGAAYKEGELKGAKSWAKSQGEKNMAAKGAKSGKKQDEFFAKPKSEYWKSKGTASTPAAKEGLNAVSGGGERNITVHIGKLIERMENHFSNGVQEGARDIERIVEETLVRALASASGR